jgi:hypothetical protein
MVRLPEDGDKQSDFLNKTFVDELNEWGAALNSGTLFS